MNLNYDKIKNRFEQGGHQWTSYSDLFLVLSMTFLLLFVVANLRSGTSAMVQVQALNAAREEAAEYKRQLQAYEILKDDYLQKGASADETAAYRELLDKLNLLETDAKTKAQELAKQANQAREQHQNLNRYQQMVKDIVSANLVSSSRLKKRDVVIEEQSKELSKLDTEVRVRQQEIEKNNRAIAEISEDLRQKEDNLRRVYRSSAKNQKKLTQELAALRADSEGKIAHLRQANERTESELLQTRTRLDQKNREAEKLVASLASKESAFRTQIGELQQQHQDMVDSQRRQFEEEMRSKELSAQARIERERSFRAEEAKRAQEFQNRLTRLNEDLAGTRDQLREAGSKYQASLSALQKSNETLQRDLQASIRKLNEQRSLAEQIKKNFAKAGIQAEVDPKTGDVSIQFYPEYFDTDSSALKPNMKTVLEKTFPIYARSLFQDRKIASRLTSVEIIGFASPTFQGKLVDPNSLSPEDRLAVNYNMDLSYRRAKGIFEYVFNPQKVQFENQKALLPLVKVSGRSYLASETSGTQGNRAPASGADFCKTMDCSKSQKVIIKFNLKE